MSSTLKIGGIVAIAIALLASGFAIGYVWDRSETQAISDQLYSLNENLGSMMLGFRDFRGMMGFGDMMDSIPDRPSSGETLSLNEAVEVAEAYTTKYWGDDLEISEVMQFDNHFYAQAIETQTGVHAFEVLIDPYTAEVHPEPGPNMMWNTKYGMMGSGGMMGGFGGMMRGSRNDQDNDMTLSPERARTLAQSELDKALPGTSVDEEVDTFYGYYTIHYLHNGEISGMLSVNGYTGQVWIHTWHGDFVDMTEHTHS
ncbi:MAG: hypothetical protein JSV37_00865 [Anaerolineaceae bacterium]|nr:MAG: hypothetical protein JSV37_00865 [Anaerolineaceae bacterium]